MKVNFQKETFFDLLQLQSNELLTKLEDEYISGNYKNAIDMFEAIPYIKQIPETVYILGHSLMKIGNSQSALEVFEQCNQISGGKNSKFKNCIGLILFSLNKYQHAYDYFHQAIECDSLQKNYRINLAITYEKLIKQRKSKNISNKNLNSNAEEEKYGEKIFLKEEYLHLLQIDQKSIVSMINLSIIEAESSNISTAFELLNKAKSFDPNDFRIHLNLGMCHLKEQNIHKAVECFKDAISLNPNYLKLLKVYLITLTKLDKWEEVQNVCLKILKLNKHDTMALALLTKSMKEKEQVKPLNSLLAKIQKKLEVMEENGKMTHEKFDDKRKKIIFKLKKKILFRRGENRKLSVMSMHYENENYELNTNIEKAEAKLPGELEVNDNFYKDPKEYLKILKNERNSREALFDLAMSYYTRQDFINAEENFLKLIYIDAKYKSDFVFERLGDIHFKRFKNVEKALNYYQNSIKTFPKPIIYVKLGRCYEKLNNHENAINEYKNSIELDPKFVWGIFHLGCIYSKLKNTDALKFLKKAFEMGPDNTDIIAKYCDELVKTEDNTFISQAIQILENTKKKFVGNVEILISLAKGYEKRKDLSSAINILEKANSYSEFYSSPDRLFILGLFLEKSKKFQRSIEIYKNILALNKDHTDSLLHLAFILLNSREYRRAFKYFLYAAKTNPNLSHVFYGLGRIYHHMKNYEEAIDNFMQCISNDYNNYRLGLIYTELLNYNKANEMFEKSLEIKPNYVLGKVGLGNVYYELGDFEKSESLNLEAYHLDKNELLAVVGYANSLVALHRYWESIKYYREALKLNDGIAEIHFSIANSYYLLDRFQDAIFHYVRAIKIDRNFRNEIYLNMGNALSAVLRYKEAIKSYKQFIKFDSSNSDAYFNLGNCYYANQYYVKAIKYYEECLKRNYSDCEVKLALCRVYFEWDNIKCKEYLETLLIEDPNNTKYLLYYAMNCEKLKDVNEAICYYEKILQIEPENNDAKSCLEFYKK